MDERETLARDPHRLPVLAALQKPIACDDENALAKYRVGGAARPSNQRLDLLIEYVRTAERDGEPLRDDAVVRREIARLVTDAEVSRVLGLRVVAASMKGEKVPDTPPPTIESSQYKLFATEFSRRLANASMDLAAPGSQLRVRTEAAPMEGRAESTYRYTVIDTIGGGTSEVQKNIIARRALGLPKNF